MTNPYKPAIKYPWKQFVPTNPEEHNAKMQDQFKLIRDLAESKGGRAKIKIKVPVMFSSILMRDEKKDVLVARDDDSTLDEGVEMKEISPNLARMLKEPPIERHIPGEEALTPTEQGRLARELAEYRHKNGRTPAYQRRWGLVLFVADPFEQMKQAVPVSEPVTVETNQLAQVS